MGGTFVIHGPLVKFLILIVHDRGVMRAVVDLDLDSSSMVARVGFISSLWALCDLDCSIFALSSSLRSCSRSSRERFKR